MKAAMIAMMTAALMVPACAGAKAKHETLTGAALVFDGDTIMLSLRKIRLLGMDAPELNQTCQHGGMDWPCGIQARDALTDLVKGKTVSCELNGRHSYGRPLAHCHVGATDLGAWMMEQGWAMSDPRFDQPYLPQQARAKAAKRGMWSGTFQQPCAYRGSC